MREDDEELVGHCSQRQRGAIELTTRVRMRVDDAASHFLPGPGTKRSFRGKAVQENTIKPMLKLHSACNQAL